MSERSGSLISLPLQGKRILVTRTRQQAGVLSERLRALGAIPIEFPTIQIVAPQDWEPLDNALKRLCMADATPGRPQGSRAGASPAPTIHEKSAPEQGNRAGASPTPTIHEIPAQPSEYYDWLVFTSVNGVSICFERLRSLGYDAGAIGNARVAAIGPATAAALARYGISVDLVPGEYIAEGVAAALIDDARQRGESLQGRRILLARAAEARKALVTGLQQAGAVVDEVAAYHTVAVANDDEQGREVLRLLQTHQLDILTFTSSSTVRHFMHWLVESSNDINVGTRPKIACIGPITSQTARELGLDVDIEAKEFTIDGLVEAIVRYEEEA